MTAPILAAAIYCSAVSLSHVTSIMIAIYRFRRAPRRGQLSNSYPPVSLIRPLCGIDNYADDTLRSTFEIV